MDHNQYITNESERKSGKHLTGEDRGAIQAMKKLKYSNRKIASYLHCSPTTVSNELKRGTPEKKNGRGRKAGYSASRGKAVYQANRKKSRKPHKIEGCQRFIRWVLNQMRQCNWSIDACVGYAPKGISIEQFSNMDILTAADSINGLPRKKLDYATPEELFDAFLDSVYAA